MSGMSDRELKFRQLLLKSMFGAWQATIHVENHLNPGVPDLSYAIIPVARSPHVKGYETGWLELKSYAAKDKFSIRVESGQHKWMTNHVGLVPAHFLIEIGETCWLIDGGYHGELAQTIDTNYLDQHSIAQCHNTQLLSLRHWFAHVTSRG